MDKILFSNSFKNLMVALGAKTSDSSYAVPLINKTSGAPQGYMEMSALASVLGEIKMVIAPNNPVTNLDDMAGEQNTIFRFGQQNINGLVGCYGLGRCIIVKDYCFQAIVHLGTLKIYYRGKFTPSGQTFEWPSTWKEIATV